MKKLEEDFTLNNAKNIRCSFAAFKTRQFSSVVFCVCAFICDVEWTQTRSSQASVETKPLLFYQSPNKGLYICLSSCCRMNFGAN